MKPTPTSPLIEGIIEEFDKKFNFGVNGYHSLQEGPETYYNIINFLSSSLQKVESETVERCLKILKDTYKFPFNILESGGYDLPVYGDEILKKDIEKVKLTVEAIKKEFNKE